MKWIISVLFLLFISCDDDVVKSNDNETKALRDSLAQSEDIVDSLASENQALLDSLIHVNENRLADRDSLAQELNIWQDSLSQILATLNEQGEKLDSSNTAYIEVLDSLRLKQSQMDSLGGEFDIKANKMRRLLGLFEAIARQPEFKPNMVKIAEQQYDSVYHIYPLGDSAIYERGKVRGQLIAELLESIARQPEAFGMMDSVAMRFVGTYESLEYPDKITEIASSFAFTAIYEAIGRQPEAAHLFDSVSNKYLNHDLQLEVPK